LVDDPDFELLMINASHIKAHPHASGAKGGNQDMDRTKGAQHEASSGRGCAWASGPSSYYCGYTADCTQAAPLIKGLDAKYLHVLADRGYDSNDIVNQVESQGAISVIPPRKNRKKPTPL